jgi:hypothetical protein
MGLDTGVGEPHGGFAGAILKSNKHCFLHQGDSRMETPRIRDCTPLGRALVLSVHVNVDLNSRVNAVKCVRR